MVSISPNILEFKAPFTQSSTEYITVTNDTSETIVFKVKTTAPKLYCVRPNAAAIEPGESIDVSVIFLGLKEEPDQDYKCNDKFLIVSLPAPYSLGDETVAEVWPKLEAEFKAQSISKKIKVKFVQESEEDHSLGETLNGETSAVNVEQPSAKSLNQAADELSQEDRGKIDALNEKLDSNAAAEPASATVKPVKPETAVASQSSIPITTVVLFALIAFIIGWLFF